MIVQGEERWVPFDPLNHSIDRSYTNPEVLVEMGGRRADRCAICKDTPRKSPRGEPCGNCGASTIERVWVVPEGGE
jgi:hypothetical protein